MRKNQQWAIGTAIAIIAIVLTLRGQFWNIQTTQPSIDYWLDNSQTRYYATIDNSITIYCRNGGDMDGDFYLVTTFANATFSSTTSMPYLSDTNRVKVRFLLHQGESNQKTIFFNIDENFEGFSISLALEKVNQDPMKENALYPCFLQYMWNDTYRSFEAVEK